MPEKIRKIRNRIGRQDKKLCESKLGGKEGSANKKLAEVVGGSMNELIARDSEL